MCMQNLNFGALPVPEIIQIGGTQKISAVLATPWIRPRFIFSYFFSRAFIRMDPVIVLAKFKVRSFTHS